jgi:hypothetical protein
MKIKQTIKTLLCAILISVGVVSYVGPSVLAASCGGAQTSIISCAQAPCANNGTVGDNGKCPDGTKPSGKVENNGVFGILLLAINILTAGVGVAAIGGIVYGSILYTSAGGSPEQVKKAVGIITNVVIGVIAYALMFSLLNFIIPGGLFKP